MSNNFYGLYRAVVRDNVDPEQRHRLKIDAPVLGVVSWAEACVPSSQFSSPSVGDSVWLMFEAGDINHPVWVGVRPGQAA